MVYSEILVVVIVLVGMYFWRTMKPPTNEVNNDVDYMNLYVLMDSNDNLLEVDIHVIKLE